MSSVAIIDYGMGNLHSIAKALRFVDMDVSIHITANPEQIMSSDRIVFPGVGAIRDCIDELYKLKLTKIISEVVKTKPMLGICVGMEAMLTHSEENNGVRCLNIIPGQVRRFPANQLNEHGECLKIPHMGWNKVHQRQAHPLWENITQDSYFYFVHSYYAEPIVATAIAATTDYAISFACALQCNNFFAVQFHPEKSQKAGLQLLHNFLKWDGNN